MDFLEIANARQSCRSYDETKPVEEEKLSAILRHRGAKHHRLCELLGGISLLSPG